MKDIIDKIHNKLPTELIHIIYKYIHIDDNLKTIKRQKKLKTQLHIELFEFLFKQFIEKLKEIFYVDNIDNDTVIIYFFEIDL